MDGFQKETVKGGQGRSSWRPSRAAELAFNAGVRTKDAAPPGGTQAAGARTLRQRPGGQTQGPAGKVGGSDAFSSVC